MTRVSDLRAGTSGIEDFFIEYLGTPSQPAPFGGRAAELAGLNTWLADPHASPYALLSGPAGSGKSALLAHWANSLAQQGQIQVIFYPISLRFNTALKSVIFATLGTHLAEIYGEPVQQVHLSAEQWHEVCRSYLNRTPDRSLLIILDGLDQAIDWQPAAGLFPDMPFPGLRVVASVRFQEEGDLAPLSWWQRLAWDRPGFGRQFPLTGLNREGVREVLAVDTTDPERALIREMAADDLFQLSQGDPLVVRLYSEAMTPGGGAPLFWLPGALTSLKPGLAGYIQQWGTKLRRQSHARPGLLRAVLGLVNLCATALGPLSRADLLRLAPDFLGESQLLDEAIHLAAGLIIEDAVKQHYVFRHLRLGEFFTDHLSVEERQAWQARFLSYGRETLAALEAGTLRPDDAPAYVIQYYGAHLNQAAASPQEFYALLNQSWLAAWLRLEQSYSGFLNDVERAWQQAEGAGNLPIQILCALSQASVATLSVNLHHLVLAKAVDLGVMTPAQSLAIARQKPKEAHYIWTLIELFPYLPESLLKLALTELKATSNSWKITALLKLSAYLTSTEEKKEAMQAAWKEALFSHNVFTQLRVLHQITPYFPELTGLQAAVAEQAMTKALTMPRRELHNDSPKIEALIRIAPHLSPELRKRALLKAYNLATDLYYDDSSRPSFLVDLLPLMPESLKLDATREALGAIINVLGSMIPQPWHVETMARLVPHLPPSLHEETMQRVSHLSNPAIRAEVLALLLPVLSSRWQEVALAETLALLQQVEDGHAWVIIVSRLAPFLPEALKQEMFDRGLKLAQEETRSFPRAWQLAHLGIHLAEPLKTEVLREALAVTLKFEDEYSQSKVLPIFVSHLTRDLLGEVLGKRSAADERAYTKILSSLVLHLASAGALEDKLFPEALAAVLAMPERENFDKSPRAEGLITLAPHLPDNLRAEALDVIRTMPQTGEDEKILRVKSLVGLFPYLPDHLREKTIQDILSGIRELPQDKPIGKYWPELMRYVSQQLPEPFRTQAWQEALAVIETIPVEEWRGAALAAFTPALPDNLKETALIIIKGMTQEETRLRNLVKFGPYLSDNLLPEAWAILLTVNTLRLRTEGMRGLIPYLPGYLLTEALPLIRTSENWPKDRAKVLTGLLQYLPETVKPDIWTEALQIAHNLDRPDEKAQLMVDIVPYLPEAMRDR